MRRHVALDGLRGIAIAFVLVFHFGATQVDTLRGAAVVLRMGWVGVDLFFVLSGLLITDILLRARDAPHYFRNFWGRRVLRIVPACFALLAMCLVVLPAMFGDLDLGPLRSRQGWLWSFTPNVWVALHGTWGFRSTSFDFNHMWSLAIEEQFYLFWPIVVWLVPPRRLARTIPLVIVLGVAARIAMVAWHLNGERGAVIYSFTPVRLDGLLLGALLALRRQHAAPPLSRAAKHLMALSFAALLALLVVRDARHEDAWVSTVGFLLVALASTSLVVASLRPEEFARLARIATSRPLVTLGKYSYGTYLIHGVLRPWVAAIVTSLAPKQPWVQALLATALGSIAAFALAVLSFHVIEQGFLRLKDVYFKGA
jgi:peptidoglycan/LPS O-acetylase OafA/YrhL